MKYLSYHKIKSKFHKLARDMIFDNMNIAELGTGSDAG
jgi:hypothetical protein